MPLHTLLFLETDISRRRPHSCFFNRASHLLPSTVRRPLRERLELRGLWKRPQKPFQQPEVEFPTPNLL
jgi:hypothetical protein